MLVAGDAGTPAPGTPPPAPAPAAEPTPAPPAVPIGALTWDQIKAAIPEDLRGDKSMETITSLEGLTKSYIHSQKAIGSDKISVPDKHSTPEDWRALSHKLGNPEKLEDYKYSLEGEDRAFNDDVMDKVKFAAHEAGVLPWQFEKMVNTFNEAGMGVLNESKTANEASYNEQIAGLKKEWGEQYDTQLRKANVAFKEFIPDADARKAFIDSGLGGDPQVVRMLANAAKLLSEDTFIGHGDGKLGGMTPKDALDKAQEIQGNPDHAYRNVEHPNHLNAKKEVANLYAIAYPE